MGFSTDWTTIDFTTVTRQQLAPSSGFAAQLRLSLSTAELEDLRPVFEALPHMEARARVAIEQMLLEQFGGKPALCGGFVYAMSMSSFLDQVRHELQEATKATSTTTLLG